jgi:hypothetical protein
MRESSASNGEPSKAFKGTEIPNCSPDAENRFATAVRALWPRKTAAELAFRGKVSERAAKFWLSGERLPSHEILMAILREIDGRH